MDIEEFKKLPDGCTVVWNGSDRHTGMSGTLHVNGDAWVVKWEKGFPCAGTYLHIHEYSNWVSHVGLRTFTYTGPIPSGYESTGEFRVPTTVDHYLHTDGQHVVKPISGVKPSGTNNIPKGPRLILRPVVPPWTAPKWMKPGCWLWSNTGDLWHLSNQKPEVWKDALYSCAEGSLLTRVGEFTDNLIAGDPFTPPPWRNWKESLRQIPEHGA